MNSYILIELLILMFLLRFSFSLPYNTNKIIHKNIDIMIYTYEDDHKIVKALKKKGWVLFEVYGNRVTEENGIHGGWWIDCSVAFETIHQESHKAINHKYLGNTLRDALIEVKDINFPTNLKK